MGHFAEEEQSGWDRRLANAYDLRSYREAKAALLRIHNEFETTSTRVPLAAWKRVWRKR